jgi:hypothetical protein
MKLSAPKTVVWVVAVIVGVLGILGNFTAIAFVSANAFWMVTIGFALLALGTAVKGM